MTQPGIQMVDLHTQYQRFASELEAAFAGILESTAFINGPEVKAFQQALEAYLEVDHVIPCANGTDALQIALMALELEPGDEVIVPAFTFVASVEVIGLLGFTPVVIDVDPDTFNMDVSQLEALITGRTRAIMPVHLFGQCCDMESILQIASKHDIKVVEDNAQSIGAQYTFGNGRVAYSGTMGEIGTLSFYPSKNLGCYGDGGALMSNDERLAAEMRSICNHGMIRRYYHDRLGVNSRLDSFQAAVLRIKLQYLDEYVRARQAAAAHYDGRLAGLTGIKIPTRAERSTHVFHQYTLQVKDGHRDALKEYLQEHGIPSMIYYPVPLQEQKAFRELVRTPVSLEHTNDLCQRVLSLPMHTELSADQLDHICDTIEAYFAQ
ncbi:MAG: DegT/DnrJ/EryC1/StrS family aminotransferase [Saprospiraceae bacterium]|nr:DegT/DnrJ/EryC1/StrS family aminotransferase [Saprospiraceae bacterium]